MRVSLESLLRDLESVLEELRELERAIRCQVEENAVREESEREEDLILLDEVERLLGHADPH